MKDTLKYFPKSMTMVFYLLANLHSHHQTDIPPFTISIIINLVNNKCLSWKILSQIISTYTLLGAILYNFEHFIEFFLALFILGRPILIQPCCDHQVSTHVRNVIKLLIYNMWPQNICTQVLSLFYCLKWNRPSHSIVISINLQYNPIITARGWL